MGGLLEAMDGLHGPVEACLDDLDRWFHPHRAPDHFVPFLARWVDLERLFCDGGQPLPSHPLLTTHLGNLRELVVVAADLARWRGTVRGLTTFLTTATGLGPFIIDDQPLGDDGRVIPFHVRITAPAAAASVRAMIEHIIAQEKPAHVTWELHFRPERQLPDDEDSLPLVLVEGSPEGGDDHGG
jgi:phage tail-like protein